MCWINVRKRVREYLECNGGSICSRFQFENQLHVLKSIEFFMVFILLSCEWHGESTNANKIAKSSIEKGSAIVFNNCLNALL